MLTTIFLKAKHWQLFTITVGIPFLLQFYAILFPQFGVELLSNENEAVLIGVSISISFVYILSSLVCIRWFWAIAIGLQNKVPPTVKMKVKKFKFCFFFPLVYMSVFAFGGFILFYQHFRGNSLPNLEWLHSIFGLIFLLHITAMLCMLYVPYFAAKTFKTVELQQEVGFSEHFSGEFVMLLFYPVGVWMIQPKINEMMKED
jgi:hypothetical protein